MPVLITTTTTTTTFLRPSGFCLGQPRCASTSRNIHPLTPVMVIRHPLSAYCIYYDPWHPPCSVYMPDNFLHNLCPSFIWSMSWPGNLYFILHTFPHPIIAFFHSTCPYYHNLFCCSTRLCHLFLVSHSTLYLELYLVA